MKKLELQGQKFGRLLVVKECLVNATRTQWECLCDCGTVCITPGRDLKNGSAQSCGCLRRERIIASITTHNRSRTPEYRNWAEIKKRCFNKKCPCYPSYGGNGITMDERWVNSFMCFFEDMGERPGKTYSIDRINNKLGYCKSNCRWATKTEQSANRFSTIWLEHNGKILHLAEWSRKLKVGAFRIKQRLEKGYTFSEIYKHFKGGIVLPRKKRIGWKYKFMMGFNKTKGGKYECVTCGGILERGIGNLSNHWCECTGNDLNEALKIITPLSLDKVGELRQKHLTKN